MEMKPYPQNEKTVYEVETQPAGLEAGTVNLEEKYGKVQRGLKSKLVS